jgi:hypothetical protein
MNEKHIKLLEVIESGNLIINDSTIELLNELLITKGHKRHQLIAKILQDVKSPSTIPFARRALESNFDYLEYTCSDSDAIAKWFSWLLFSIGTEDAIELIREYTQSADDGISEEMIYRLSKIS